jgi:hypothetical protein
MKNPGLSFPAAQSAAGMAGNHCKDFFRITHSCDPHYMIVSGAGLEQHHIESAGRYRHHRKSPMFRYSFVALAIIGSAATAIAAIVPGRLAHAPAVSAGETVIEKNQAFPLVGPLVVEECLNDDCTITRM